MSEHQPAWPSQEQLEAGYSAVHNHLAALEGLGALRQALDAARQAEASRAALMAAIEQLEVGRAEAHRQFAEDVARMQGERTQLEAAIAEQRSVVEEARARAVEDVATAQASVRRARTEARNEVEVQRASVDTERQALVEAFRQERTALEAQHQALRDEVAILEQQKATLEAELKAIVGRVSVG
jgi:predicted nuclease with TOPRIM domain